MTNTEKPIYGEWQGMETADKYHDKTTGKTKLILVKTISESVFVAANFGDGRFFIAGHSIEITIPIKCWMPLPTGREGEAMRKMREALNDIYRGKTDMHPSAIAWEALAKANEIMGE